MKLIILLKFGKKTDFKKDTDVLVTATGLEPTTT